MSELVPTHEALEVAIRSWVGTPYHHQARLKGVGVDCIGTLICPANEVGFNIEDVHGYSTQPYGEQLMKEIEKRLLPVPIQELETRMRPLVLVFGFEKKRQSTEWLPQHVAYFMSNGNMVHSMNRVKRVLEHEFKGYWRERLHSVWDLPWQLSP